MPRPRGPDKRTPHREIRRRTGVVGIFPDRNSAIRLIGAVLARSRMALINTDETTTEKEDMTPAALTA